MGSWSMHDAKREESWGRAPPEWARRMRRDGNLSRTPESIRRVVACSEQLGRSFTRDSWTYDGCFEWEAECKRKNVAVLTISPCVFVDAVMGM